MRLGPSKDEIVLRGFRTAFVIALIVLAFIVGAKVGDRPTPGYPSAQESLDR